MEIMFINMHMFLCRYMYRFIYKYIFIDFYFYTKVCPLFFILNKRFVKTYNCDSKYKLYFYCESFGDKFIYYFINIFVTEIKQLQKKVNRSYQYFPTTIITKSSLL